MIASRLLIIGLVASALTACTTLEERRQRAEVKKLSDAKATSRADHAAWRGAPGWRDKTYRNEALIALATDSNSAVEIALSEQRGLLLVDELIAMDFPVATGKRSHPTPAGSYKILGKVKDYKSNLYGKIVDAAGTVVVADADSRTDAIPEGGSFQGARMPYWMRLTNDGVGMHVGYVPGRPASHGCIRLRKQTAGTLFGIIKTGTPVVIAQAAPALAVAKP